MGHHYTMSNFYIKAAESRDLVRTVLAVSLYRDDDCPPLKAEPAEAPSSTLPARPERLSPSPSLLWHISLLEIGPYPADTRLANDQEGSR